ncbi:hypothetical protein [Nostoc sp.]|uniref:hypothetical protein n=1 Tax=Nostoc sp. TaxID=1180 RepID=UPI003FA5E6E6
MLLVQRRSINCHRLRDLSKWQYLKQVALTADTNVAWVKGDRLQSGKYIIERELGRGRFGITYLVKNKKGDRQVIKTLTEFGGLIPLANDGSTFWVGV